MNYSISTSECAHMCGGPACVSTCAPRALLSGCVCLTWHILLSREHQAGVPLPETSSGLFCCLWEQKGRGTFQPWDPAQIISRGPGYHLRAITELCPAWASSRDSLETAPVLLGPIRRGSNTPTAGGLSLALPTSLGAQQTHPPPCSLPGRRLTHDLFIKSHYLCQRRTELLAF